jgi:hypothetical protein
MTTDRISWRQVAGGLICLLILSALTVVEQYSNLFDTGSMQIERHVALLANESLDPWQYRMFSVYVLEGYLYVVRTLGLSRDPMTAMLVFRALQNLALFALAWLFYRSLGLRSLVPLLGLVILAFGMGQATFESDLSFNLYFDLIFYLAAVLLIARRWDGWLIPLSILAAANRETSLLIPFLLVAARVGLRPLKVDRKATVIAGVALIAQIGVYLGIRAALGPKEQFFPHGVAWGWELLRYNLARWETWQYLGATFSIIPLLSLALFRRWPDILRRYFWVMVPVWLVLHTLLGVLAETRILLVPYALVLLPGALLGIQASLREETGGS